MKSLAVLTAPVMVFCAVVALAQSEAVYPRGGNQYGGNYYAPRASTAGEGALRGMGDLVRSQGQANLDNSAAAINLTTARSNQINNYRSGTSAYFDMRELNRRARAAERGPKTTMEQAVRFTQWGKPKPLSSRELDVVTGEINWPMALQSDQFAANRSKLEKVFSSRAASGASGLEDFTEARDVTQTMLADLKKQVQQVPAQQYMPAKRFLQSLAYAAGQPTG